MTLVSCFTRITSVIAFLFLFGCANTPKPIIVKVSLHAQPVVNPDSRGRSSPVVVRYYELKARAALDSADFFSLMDSTQDPLAKELIYSEVFNLRGGEKVEFNRPLHPDVRYIGAVAEFQSLERSQWRATLAIPPKQKISRVLIQLDGNRVLIGAEGECLFLCKLSLQKPTPLGDLQEITIPDTK